MIGRSGRWLVPVCALALTAALGCGSASEPDANAVDVADDDTTMDTGASDTGVATDTPSDSAETDTGTVGDGGSDAVEPDDTSVPSDTGAADAGADDGGSEDADADLDVRVPPMDTGPPDCGDLTACGITCADLATDPTNCGACGVTCIIPNAAAACVDGSCAVGACEPGFFDEDGAIGNGCETESVCIPDVPCVTSCGGEATVVCDGIEAVCPGPEETCNAMDDDCDGMCDEGPLRGCRHGVHRGNGYGHVYSDDLELVSSFPFSVESENYFYLYSDAAGTMRPVFLCNKGLGMRFLTSATDCEIGRAPERTIGFWSPTPTCGAVPLYRMHQASSNNHFYTISAAERDRARDELGYREEGIAGYVWRSP